MKKIFKAVLPFLLLAIVFSPFSAFASSLYYTNVNGSKVHVPVKAQVAPKGVTAQCKDKTYSFSKTRRGTCSHHGGIKTWYE